MFRSLGGSKMAKMHKSGKIIPVESSQLSLLSVPYTAPCRSYCLLWCDQKATKLSQCRHNKSIIFYLVNPMTSAFLCQLQTHFGSQSHILAIRFVYIRSLNHIELTVEANRSTMHQTRIFYHTKKTLFRQKNLNANVFTKYSTHVNVINTFTVLSLQ